jgi:pimeloyl-ACP methyl ester carboxylesterase
MRNAGLHQERKSRIILDNSVCGRRIAFPRLKGPLLAMFALVLSIASAGFTYSTIVKTLLLTIGIMIVIVCTGCVYQFVATVSDKNNYPPPGRLVNINGCRLHIQEAGTGTPTVILEAGLSAMSSVWGWIHPEVARFTKVVAYDRAGLGWSDPDGASFTALNAACHLHDLLTVSGIESPYVIVGHSMGGLLARMFAAQYVDEVAGMVLVDASHPDQYSCNPLIRRYMNSGFRLLNKIPLLAKLGYVRLTRCLNCQADGLPARQRAEAHVFLSSHRHLHTTRIESLAWETICEETRRTGNFGNKPLSVLSAGRDLLPGSLELQAELATLSSDSTHHIVKGATHVTLVTHREYALSVVEAIRQVVEKFRKTGEING